MKLSNKEDNGSKSCADMKMSPTLEVHLHILSNYGFILLHKIQCTLLKSIFHDTLGVKKEFTRRHTAQ